MIHNLQSTVRMIVHSVVLICLAVTSFKVQSQIRNLEAIEILASTPLSGLGQPREEIASNVQTLSAYDIQNSQAQNLADLMNHNVGSVHINDNQGNPFSVDLNYRGFTASPLLGAPQGLSVYMDGVRMNQPFGDVVNWELIPRGAIQGLTLIPGSNPLFGLNTLGGAISIQTKDGLSAPGNHLQTKVGANNLFAAEFQTGGSDYSGLNWFLLGSRFSDGGWRDASSSDVTQLFTKVGFKQKNVDIKLTLGLTYARLLGGGLQQNELLNTDNKSVYTKSDVVNNNAYFINFEAKRYLNDNAMFSGNFYWRKSNTDTSNADINEGSFNQGIYASGQSGVGTYSAQQVATLSGLNGAFGGPYARNVGQLNNRYSASGFFPAAACINNAASKQEPNEKCNALYSTTITSQTNFGFAGQISYLHDLSVGLNSMTVGAAYDKSITEFSQLSQFGYLNADRTMTTVNAYADGSQNSENTFDQRVDLSSGSKTISAFFTNTFSTQSQVHWTLAVRFNKSEIANSDNQLAAGTYNVTNPSINPSAVDVNGNAILLRKSLTESHSYQRLNPAVGVSWAPSQAFNSYVSFSESSRAPTSVELGCADPAVGCRLPNSMAGDPYLAQVIARTLEFGARGKSAKGLQWQAGVFQTVNSDDILFVANSSSTGYFKNFGQTKRQGVEVGLAQSVGALSYSGNFTLLDATYQSSEIISSPYNSSADIGGKVVITPGNRIPLIPKQIFKLKLSYQFTPEFRSGFQWLAISETYARGNENNQHQEGVTNGNGVATLSSGKIPSYAVINWSGDFVSSKKLTYFSSITNLFNQIYFTSGQLGPTAFRSDGGYNNGGCNGVNWNPSTHDGACSGSMFWAPGAPRTFWIGMRYLM